MTDKRVSVVGFIRKEGLGINLFQKKFGLRKVRCLARCQGYRHRISAGFIDVLVRNIGRETSPTAPMRAFIPLIQEGLRAHPDQIDAMKAEMLGGEPIFDIERLRSVGAATIDFFNERLQETRVLCVTTHRDSEHMWENYATNHAGIALRIEPNIEKDSKFKMFLPVEYKEQRPTLFRGAVEFIEDALFGDQTEALQDILDRLIYTKTMRWQKESEYRLVIHLRPNEAPFNTDLYHPDEITELYLGLAMDNVTSAEIVTFSRQINPAIAIFRMVRKPDGSLGFVPYET